MARGLTSQLAHRYNSIAYNGMFNICFVLKTHFTITGDLSAVPRNMVNETKYQSLYIS